MIQPNPGSVEAKKKGCICPISEQGAWGIFIVVEGCPLHNEWLEEVKDD